MDQISYAFGQNHYLNDRDLAAVLRYVWPDVDRHQEDLVRFGQQAGSELYEAGYHIDHDARPILVAHNLDGQRIDRVRLSPVERQALERTAWIMTPPYHGQGWPYHFALLYLLADPGLGCILTITNQTAYALHKYGASVPCSKAMIEQLLGGTAWGATWMTESQGGSDLGANQTAAQRGDGHWRLTGDKYFASGAGLADYAIVTARPTEGKAGPKGLGLYLVPRLASTGDLNFHVRRLKDKSATRAVPSGEVELMDSEAFLIGDVDQGIYYTLENLTVSRLANAVVAMAIGKKAHFEVMGRVVHRESFGRPLEQHPLIRRDLTDFSVRMAGGLALAFSAVAQFDRIWSDRPPYSMDYHVARLMTHLAKNRTAEHGAAMTQAAMELFGGLGFLEEYAAARWHREALITPIWEGPSNIQALDFLETVKRQRAHEPFLAAMESLLRKSDSFVSRDTLDRMARALERLERAKGREAEWISRDVLDTVADGAQVALLYDLADTAGERYAKLAELYHRRFLERQDYPAWVDQDPDIWSS